MKQTSSSTDSQPKKDSHEKKIKFLEHINEIELISGIVAITVAFLYQGIWIALGIAIGVIFLEAIILVEISTAKSLVKLRKQNDRIEEYLRTLLQRTGGADVSPLLAQEEKEEREDPYKWHKIAGWSALFIALTLVGNYFFGG